MQERKYLFEKKPETFRTHLKRFTGLLADLPFPGLLVALVADQHDRDPVHRTLDLDIGNKTMRATEPTRTMSTKGSQTSDLFSTSLPLFEGILVSETSNNNWLRPCLYGGQNGCDSGKNDDCN